jgi:hypothetical protein
MSGMLAEDGGDMVILSGKGIIQGRLPAVSHCTAVDVGAIADQYFGCFLIRLRVTAAAGGTSHRDGVKGCRSHNGVLIDIGTMLQEQLDGLSTTSIRCPCERRQPPLGGGIVDIGAQLNQTLAA